jgi:hypothetical protein
MDAQHRLDGPALSHAGCNLRDDLRWMLQRSLTFSFARVSTQSLANQILRPPYSSTFTASNAIRTIQFKFPFATFASFAVNLFADY